jgi:DNA invertase Pin-like site-specific DNA recombinase
MSQVIETTGKRVPNGYRAGIGYVRVSRRNGREGDSYITKEQQVETIERLAEANKVVIVLWVIEEDESGKKWDRVGFQHALDAIRDGEADVMLVAKLNRFGRRNIDVHRGLEAIEKRETGNPGQLIAGDLSVDTSTKEGRLLRGIMALLAEFELEALTEQWADSRGRALDRGIFARKAPVGYRRDGDRKLELDPEVAPLVRELFERRGSGESWAALLAWWKDAGGPKITRTGLSTVLANRVYLGEFIETDEYVVPNAHEAIVDEELFRSAQSTRALRPARRHGSLLAGVLRCSHCGQPFTASHSGKVPQYRHQSSNGTAEKCPHRHAIAMRLADAVVEEAFLAWAEARRVYAGESDAENLVAEARAELEAAEADLAAFAEGSQGMSAELLRGGFEVRNARIEEAQERVEELYASGKVETVRTSAMTLWPELELEDKRTLLAGAVDHVDVLPSTVAAGGATPEARKLAVARERLLITFKS